MSQSISNHLSFKKNCMLLKRKFVEKHLIKKIFFSCVFFYLFFNISDFIEYYVLFLFSLFHNNYYQFILQNKKNHMHFASVSRKKSSKMFFLYFGQFDKKIKKKFRVISVWFLISQKYIRYSTIIFRFCALFLVYWWSFTLYDKKLVLILWNFWNLY